jgi:hypothetical protein
MTYSQNWYSAENEEFHDKELAHFKSFHYCYSSTADNCNKRNINICDHNCSL